MSPSLGLSVAILNMSLILPASGANAQLRVGGHLVGAPLAFNGTYGAGLRAGIELPNFPSQPQFFDFVQTGMDLIASGEYFLPDCSGCGLWGLSLDANLWIQLPLVRPYTSAGVVYRNASDLDRSQDHGIGLGVGLGADADMAGVRAFGEARLELIDGGWWGLWRVGVLIAALRKRSR